VNGFAGSRAANRGDFSDGSQIGHEFAYSPFQPSQDCQIWLQFMRWTVVRSFSIGKRHQAIAGDMLSSRVLRGWWSGRAVELVALRPQDPFSSGRFATVHALRMAASRLRRFRFVR
jgi:hypothetical protein